MAVPFSSCVHTHTKYCDGKDAPEVLVQKALELQFVSLGFSSHGPTWWDPYSLKQEDAPLYREEIRHLQQVYGDRLEIFLGIEHDSLGEPVGAGYDYVIESVHAMMAGGELCFIDWSLEKTQTAIHEQFGGDPYAYAKAYFRTCAEAYEANPAQIMGHPDLLTKFNEKCPMFDVSDRRFLHPALEAMDCALGKGLIPEVNTGAISRGYRTSPYPCKPILEYLLERNAPIVVTSDCHDAANLDCRYAETAELLRAMGFRSTLRMRKTGWEEIGL